MSSTSQPPLPAFPPYYGVSFTPTTHTSIPPNLSPSSHSLRTPFVAVITGAGKGIGYHIALSYARAGCTALCISSRTASDLDALAAEVEEVRPEVEVLKQVCDTRSDEDVAALADAVGKRWGRADAVVANAGVISAYVARPSTGSDNASSQSNLPVGIVEDTDWARVLDVNLLGVWRTARAFLPLLARSTDGPQTFIAVTSLAAHSADSVVCPVAYNVSKMTVNRLVEHIANDHGEGKEGIMAYALHPGAVRTPQTEGHSGGVWDVVKGMMGDEVGLAGAMSVWLSREKRGWLSGRYVASGWDVEELEGMKDEIVREDKLKFRMVV